MRTNMESTSRHAVSKPTRPHSLRRIAWRSGMMMVLASTSLTGCKSAMPKFNMFGFKREPSPEALAGTGPRRPIPFRLRRRRHQKHWLQRLRARRQAVLNHKPRTSLRPRRRPTEQHPLPAPNERIAGFGSSNQQRSRSRKRLLRTSPCSATGHASFLRERNRRDRRLHLRPKPKGCLGRRRHSSDSCFVRTACGFATERCTDLRSNSTCDEPNTLGPRQLHTHRYRLSDAWSIIGGFSASVTSGFGTDSGSRGTIRSAKLIHAATSTGTEWSGQFSTYIASSEPFQRLYDAATGAPAAPSSTAPAAGGFAMPALEHHRLQVHQPHRSLLYHQLTTSIADRRTEGTERRNLQARKHSRRSELSSS